MIKIKEPKKLVAYLLLIYIIISLVFIYDNTSKQQQTDIKEITGLSSSGVVVLNLIPSNVTACITPSKPVLIPVKDTPYTTIMLSWSSSKTGSEYDEFVFDSEQPVNKESPVTERSLSIATHMWQVRTCQTALCCSDYATDVFKVLTSHPTAQVVQEVIPPVVEKPQETIIPLPVKLRFRGGGIYIQGIYLGLLILAVIFSTLIILMKKPDEAEKKREKLRKYVLNATERGFTEQQIRNKLVENGVTEKDIELLLGKTKH